LQNEEKTHFIPKNMNQNNEDIYQEELRQYIPNQNIHKEIYGEERNRYMPPQYFQQGQEMYQMERRHFIPKKNINQNEEYYNEESRYYIPQQNIDQTEDIYQFERNNFIPIKNINQNEEYYNEDRRLYIPQPNIKLTEEIYKEESRQFSQQLNNNQNYMNYGHKICPIHGIQGRNNRFVQNQNHIFEEQRQIRQNENTNEFTQNQQQIFHTHEDIGGMIGDTNNYKFYESKNIKRKEGKENYITLHYTRGGEEKESSYSNVYIASKAIPINSNSNYQQFQLISQTNSSKINNKEHSHFCPIHGNKNIHKQQQDINLSEN
jgi:hypothetical protein